MGKRPIIIITRLLFALLPMLCTGKAFAQQYKITGKVVSIQGAPVSGARVFIKNDYEFVYSVADGRFEISVIDTGSYMIVAEYGEYRAVEMKVKITAEGEIPPLLLSFKEKNSEYLTNVTIRSSRLNATNDKAKAVLLNKLDVLTTAGANADITSALKTLPGTQQAVSENGLFVRGGSGREAKFYIDGMRSSNFFYSGAPDVTNRGRFPPSLFKGTYFSSGGYSAQYGQALSSVIILETEDLPERTSVDFNIGTAGLGASTNILSKNQKMSYGGSVNYLDLKPYYGFIKQKYDFITMPRFLDGSVFFRIKSGKRGILKMYTGQAYSNLALRRQNIDYDYRKDYYSLENSNTYLNVSYHNYLQKEWVLESAFAFGRNEDKYKLGLIDNDVMTAYKDSVVKNNTLQARITFKKNFGPKLSFLAGTEAELYNKKYTRKSSFTASNEFRDFYGAVYSEVSYKANSKLNMRLGIRGEFSSLLNKPAIAPRAMLDYNFVKDYHFSANYGQFFQSPEEDLFYSLDNMRFQKATHYIVSFQKVKRNAHTFRTEAYYKKYDRLTSFNSDTSQSGYGYAKGIELFWRHKINEKSFEYWISYSMLDSKRKFLAYPKPVQPSFVADHALSAVVKRYFDKISVHVAVSWSYESGKPYYNPQKPQNMFLSDRTPDFQTTNLSLAYVRTIKKVYSIFVFTMSNVFNQRQVFGYRYSAVDHNRWEPLTPLAPRFFFLGAFFSLGIDRTKDAFDRSL